MDITLSSLLFFRSFFYYFRFNKVFNKGSVIYWSDRIGKNNKIFNMPKFRTMNLDTPSLASHLLENLINTSPQLEKY